MAGEGEEQYLTVSCRVMTTPEQAAKIEATLAGFCEVCTFINSEVPPKVTSKFKLQSAIYQEVRQEYPRVNSNLVIAALGRVAASRRSAKARGRRVKRFFGASVDYNARTFSLRTHDFTASLTMVGGRERVKLGVGTYQCRLLAGTEPTSATLVKRRAREYYLNIQVPCAVPAPSSSVERIRVTFGIETIASLSTGEVYSGAQLEAVRDRYARVRASLQKKASAGTRTTRRNCRKVLKRLSRRERRFATGVNHRISTKIVERAKERGATLVLEELSGVRERVTPLLVSKDARRRVNRWAFLQLREFIEYKARIAGVAVVVECAGEKKDLMGRLVNPPERSLLRASA